MIKLNQILINQKQIDEIPVDFTNVTKEDAVATVNNKYRCEIVKNDDDKWSSDSEIKVYCSCPDFQFRWAYVLSKNNALLNASSFVLEPPKEKNPGMKVGACKHLAAMAKRLIEK